MTETLEHTAQRIADQGRSALLARLRPAFTEAVRAHSDVLNLDGDQLEQMVQRAADRADGLQWRRALADVATEQLGITLGEALSHPAVARAQAIVGAPSYEDSLAALGPVPGLEAKPAQPAEHDEAADATEEEPEAPDGEADGQADAQAEAEATAEVEGRRPRRRRPKRRRRPRAPIRSAWSRCISVASPTSIPPNGASRCTSATMVWTSREAPMSC